MNEPLSSNPLVTELRNPPPWKPLNPEREALILRAADEIARLTAELERARAEARAMHSAYDTSIALQARLRAALTDVGMADTLFGAKLIASASLAGAADETSAGRTKRGPWKTDDNGEPL